MPIYYEVLKEINCSHDNSLEVQIGLDKLVILLFKKYGLLGVFSKLPAAC
jgi:hypothetical protein